MEEEGWRKGGVEEGGVEEGGWREVLHSITPRVST